MRTMIVPGMTFTNGRARRPTTPAGIDGSDKTAGRGVRQRPPRSAQILDSPKRRLNSFRNTLEPLEIEGRLERNCGKVRRLRPSIISTLGKSTIRLAIEATPGTITSWPDRLSR
jgi:hypothetical protein